MPDTKLLVIAYATYTLLAVPLVVWLARTLYRHGEVFLADVFPDSAEMAAAVNKLLVTGFYMANLGFVALLLKNGRPEDSIGVIEALATRLGVLLLGLAFVHFVNLWVFSVVRRRARVQQLPPPTMPLYAPQRVG